MNARILVLGTFDLLHFGHMAFLEECAKWGDVVIGLSTDTNATSHRLPIMSYEERGIALLFMPWVKSIVPKYESDAKPIILSVRPDMLIHGWGAGLADAWLQVNQIDVVWLNAHEIVVHQAYNPNTISTTEIIERARRSVQP